MTIDKHTESTQVVGANKEKETKAARFMKFITNEFQRSTYRNYFNQDNQRLLADAIAAAEIGHLGEIRLVVETQLPLALILKNITPRQRAIEWFSQLHVWDTENNTGILLYLLLSEQKLEIVADRGIAGKVSQTEWDAICSQLQFDLAAHHVIPGIHQTIERLGQLLVTHFPMTHDVRNPNELSNLPVLVL